MEEQPEQPEQQEHHKQTMQRDMIYLYPTYIDSEVPRFKGRKLAKEECVPNPILQEIVLSAQLLGFNGGYDTDKKHPRNFWAFGRLQVYFWKIDKTTGEKTPLHSEIHTRMQFYRAVAAKIKEIREHPPIFKDPATTANPGKKLRGAEKTKMKKMQKRGLL